ncbi:T9SS type A sorting domain-containing protein [Flavobacteriaceae bacterium Ap0902]|nr:T9SS type A sorting domain-containing protein [Flavobacteriaceae bacterium Ap0902]
MNKIYFLITFLSIIVYGQVPSYYASIDFNESNEEIKSDLTSLLRTTHINRLSYTPGVWNALKMVDLDPENSDNVLLIYGYDDFDSDPVNDRSRDKDLTCHSATCSQPRWNREHIFPKSIGEFEEDGYEITDVHALRASDTNMNAYRFNSPYVDGEGNAGEVTSYRFYPGDEWKGDVARMILYMYLRYPANCKPNYVGIDTHTYSPEIPDIFLEWNAEDPVSEFEIRRNNLIAQELQGNRNPFIDNPYIATKLWGGPKAEDRWGTLSVDDIALDAFQVYPNPTVDVIYYNEHSFTAITVYDISGKIIDRDLNLKDNKTKMPNTKGMYLVEFCDKNNCNSIKVIKN